MNEVSEGGGFVFAHYNRRNANCGKWPDAGHNKIHSISCLIGVRAPLKIHSSLKYKAR